MTYQLGRKALKADPVPGVMMIEESDPENSLISRMEPCPEQTLDVEGNGNFLSSPCTLLTPP